MPLIFELSPISLCIVPCEWDTYAQVSFTQLLRYTQSGTETIVFGIKKFFNQYCTHHALLYNSGPHTTQLDEKEKLAPPQKKIRQINQRLPTKGSTIFANTIFVMIKSWVFQPC